VLTTNIDYATTTEHGSATVRLEPTGHVVCYCGRDCQEWYANVHYGDVTYGGSSFFAPVRASRAQVVALHRGY
jgi:hypothetical protein